MVAAAHLRRRPPCLRARGLPQPDQRHVVRRICRRGPFRPQRGAVHAALPAAHGGSYSASHLGHTSALPRVSRPGALDRSHLLSCGRGRRHFAFGPLETSHAVDRKAGAGVRDLASRLAAATAGLSPHKIALIVAVGLVLGAFPVYGCPTILCGLAAVALRLNLPALQLVNQVATPVQIALLVPLTRTGSWMFGYRAGFGGAVWNAVAGWLCICVPMGVLLYFTLGYVLRRSALR